MASFTITFDPSYDARILAAFGETLGLGRSATGGEVKQAIMGWVRGQVQDSERRENMRTFSPAELSGT
jgi:hypothetical protein